MALPLATRLGAYEVLRSLGAGARAKCTAGPARHARFLREAQAVAALTHPHIVTLYSREESDGVRS